MRRKRFFKTIVSMTLMLALLFTSNISTFSTKAAEGEVAEDKKDSLFYIEEYSSYEAYLAKYADANEATSEVEINCNVQADAAERAVIDEVSCVCIPHGATAEYVFYIAETGFYNIDLQYYPIEGDDSPVKLNLQLDGINPFEGTTNVSLSRYWQFEEEVRKDSQGNEIRCDSEKVAKWMRTKLKDSLGEDGDYLRFYLEAGEHCIKIESVQNAVALAKITFSQPQQTRSYDSVLAQWKEKGYQEAKASLDLIQAEQALGFSEKSISMENDRTSATTTPYHSYKIRYNCIGGGTWKTPGEWIEWEVKVPESGLYTLAVRFLQDTKNEDISTRMLTIDGELPFAEAANISFPYSSSWQTTLLGNGEKAYRFYLEEGTHTIRMTVGMGKMAEIANCASELLDRLNAVYVDIVMVTGISPDANRDYGIAKLLPDVLKEMEAISEELKKLEKQQSKIVEENKGNTTFERIYDQLDRMVEDPETVPRRLSNFQSNITSLGTWINGSMSQPLMLDYLQCMAPSEDAPRAEKGFWSAIKHHVMQFFGSFVMDYAAVGGIEAESERKITVWISSGRDQADIIRKMVNSEFTPKYGIEVELQLVNAGALLSATLADIGPDVALGVTEAEPINYALRNAVVDLSELEEAEEVFARFPEAAITAFRLDEGIYAVPETMEYPMLFYRKDILGELGIQEEDLKTWDTLLQTVLPELTLSYFDFGLTADFKSYVSLLYQHGGDIYNEGNTASALDSTAAYTAFQTMTKLYTDYKLPKSFDFANRFRSGQMPLAIVNYTMYNQLSVFAPEIEGKWGMTTLPGVVDEQGNINNSAATTVTGSVIMKNSDAVEDAWTFLKWWTQGEVQGEYANELETVLGTAARYPVANTEAMQAVQWKEDIRTALVEQQADLKGVEQIAGSYYTTRYFDFAFRDVVENGENVRESILDAWENITNEIVDKRKEFYGEGK